MSAPVESGQELLIPLFDAEVAGKPVKVNWQQSLAQRNADYYALTADNITTGNQVPFFIAAEYYKNSTKANPNHITKVGELIEGEGYKLKVDGKLQYGQKNAQGELRFVVYHDEERKPYQHRFIETAVGSATAGKTQEMAKAFGLGAAGDQIMDHLKAIVGDYLHTF
ncbi:hypothetical protein GYMLUDRAFT_45654 [Collybiopsis luxurians FD-317 M1]|uniref:Uncharacterized protein n=1 Tax=Collybiopsis luxurians FD-317 M1 TaxID=944289 RepID=A0A0D0B4A4_9AGAR|nr:hypothetical protein GYMLUDRAFT_45654 [Collybiopsis luxurians FD-317 M1]